jgi:hypothetical protein
LGHKKAQDGKFVSQSHKEPNRTAEAVLSCFLQLPTDAGFRHEANRIHFNIYSLSTTHLAVSLSRAEFVFMFIKIYSIFYEAG